MASKEILNFKQRKMQPKRQQDIRSLSFHPYKKSPRPALQARTRRVIAPDLYTSSSLAKPWAAFAANKSALAVSSVWK